jgi:hypothetical protein
VVGSNGFCINVQKLVYIEFTSYSMFVCVYVCLHVYAHGCE